MDRLLPLILLLLLTNISIVINDEYTPRPITSFVYGASEPGDQLNYYYRFGTIPYDAEYYEHYIDKEDLQPHLKQAFTILIVEYRSKSKVNVNFDPETNVIQFEIDEPSVDIRYAVAGYSQPKQLIPDILRCR